MCARGEARESERWGVPFFSPKLFHIQGERKECAATGGGRGKRWTRLVSTNLRITGEVLAEIRHHKYTQRPIFQGPNLQVPLRRMSLPQTKRHEDETQTTRRSRSIRHSLQLNLLSLINQSISFSFALASSQFPDIAKKTPTFWQFFQSQLMQTWDTEFSHERL